MDGMAVSDRIRVGLTGGIASGKSAVARQLALLGAVIIDHDLLAREVVEPGTPGLAAIEARFGPAVVTSDGALDRARLGSIVFSDEAARADLNAIVHPEVARLGDEREADAPAGSVVVHVIPLLVETGQQEDFDLLVVVDATGANQLERLRRRDDFSVEQAQARIGAQATREQRHAVADVVIDNTGTPEQTRVQVERLWRETIPSMRAGVTTIRHRANRQ